MSIALLRRLDGSAAALGAWSPASLPLTARWDWTTAKYDDTVLNAPPPASPVTANGATVTWWADGIGSRYLLAKSDAERSLLRPSGGPSTGKAGVEWDVSTRGMWAADGSFLTTAGGTLIFVVNAGDVGANYNAVCGRDGFSVYYDDAGKIHTFVVTGAGSVSNVSASDARGAWIVGALSYDGANARLKLHNQALSKVAQTGTLTFAGTAFWAGGATATGAAFFESRVKTMGGVYVTSTTYDDTAIAALVANFATYAGVS